MPPIVVTYVGFPVLLALLVGVDLVAFVVSRGTRRPSTDGGGPGLPSSHPC